MRRRTKKGSGLVKVLTAAAAAAITTGTINVYASQNFQYISVDNEVIRIDALANNEAFRQRVIDQFNAANPVFVSTDHGPNSEWMDMSQQSRPDAMVNAPLPDMILPPYED